MKYHNVCAGLEILALFDHNTVKLRRKLYIRLLVSERKVDVQFA